MCVPGCEEVVRKRLSRRGFLKAAVAATAVAAAGPTVSATAADRRERPIIKKPVARAVDMTHTLAPDFPTFFGGSQFEVNSLFEYETDGFNMNTWTLVEHTGTHMDAPLHFGPTANSAAEVPVEQLVIPLAVVDIRQKAETNADAQVTPDDLHKWEAEHGRIPRGSCVAMLSGWAEKVNGPGFRNADADGVLHFPGFHLEAAAFLIEEREVVGIAVDTLSLDYGPSPDFAVHYRWLPTNRWGLEAVANLDQLPAVGATMVAAVSKVRRATGGPARLLGLIPPGD